MTKMKLKFVCKYLLTNKIFDKTTLIEIHVKIYSDRLLI